MKFKTYAYGYKDKEARNSKGFREIHTLNGFVTLKEDVDPAIVEKRLSEALEQPIKLKLENEFEIKLPKVPLDPQNGSIYESDEQAEFEAKRKGKGDGVIEFPDDVCLDIGTVIKHPILGCGEIVDYVINTYDEYPEKYRPATSFMYAIAFDIDAYESETGRHMRPTRTFTPQSLKEALDKVVIENNHSIEADDDPITEMQQAGVDLSNIDAVREYLGATLGYDKKDQMKICKKLGLVLK